MAVTDAGEIKRLTSSPVDQTIDFSQNVSAVYVKTAGNIYIAFDREATAEDFLVASTDGIVEFDVPCTELHVISDGGTPEVYVIGRR